MRIKRVDDVASKEKRREPKQISFRVSEDEFARLEECAENVGMNSVPAFVKKKALGIKMVKPKVDRESGMYIVSELNMIGKNVNDIAKWCNIEGKKLTMDEVHQDRLIKKIEDLQKELHEIWQQLS